MPHNFQSCIQKVGKISEWIQSQIRLRFPTTSLRYGSVGRRLISIRFTQIGQCKDWQRTDSRYATSCVTADQIPGFASKRAGSR